MKKKLLIMLFLFVGSFLSLSFLNVKADTEEEYVELYPYNDARALDENSDFTAGTKVGTANWNLVYNGYRYHAVRNSMRYAKDWVDKNSDGYIDAGELNSSLSWNAFASIFVNDTDEEFIISTNNGRTDLTTVVHRMYAYFDEDGYLYKFEDQILQYWVINKGDETVTGQDWHLVDPADLVENDEGDLVGPEGSQYEHIRIMLDNSEKGYTLEPIKYITWKHIWAGEDLEEELHPESILTEENPDYVLINPQDTIISFGTLDRDGTNKNTTEFIRSMPYAMLEEEETMALNYEQQPPTFGNTLAHLDKDAATPGINFVVEYQEEFSTTDLTNGVKATYEHMFDEDGTILAATRETDYTLTIKQDGKVVEELEAIWNAEDKKYDIDGEITVINSNNFGDAFIVTYSAKSPVDETKTVERDVEVVIGVFPPKFEGVPTVTRYANEGEYIDLLEGITANDGYDGDISDLIKVNVPNGFSPYAPKPGMYEIGLEFTYNVFIAGVKSEVVFTMADGSVNKWDYTGIDVEHPTSNAANVHVYTPEGYENIVKEWANMAWTSELLIVENGLIVKAFSRATNAVMDVDNPEPTATNGNVKDEFWFKSLTLEENQMAVVVQGTSSIAVNGWAKQAFYGQELDVVMATEDIDHDFVIETSYMLQVDDLTAPELIVKDNNYKVKTGDFESAEEAILSNIIARDNFSNVSLVVTNLGNLNLSEPGKYQVTVMGIDEAGNEATVSFSVTVLEEDNKVADLENEIADLESNLENLEKDLTDKLDEANSAIADLITKLDEANKTIDEKKTGVTVVTAIIISVVTAGLAFGGAFILGKKR